MFLLIISVGVSPAALNFNNCGSFWIYSNLVKLKPSDCQNNSVTPTKGDNAAQELGAREGRGCIMGEVFISWVSLSGFTDKTTLQQSLQCNFGTTAKFYSHYFNS